MGRIPRRLSAGRAAWFVFGLLVVAIAAMPFTRAIVGEWISMRTGGWEYWIPGYTDGHNWIPVEDPISPSGPNAEFIRAYLDEDGKSDAEYVRSHPDDLALRCLFLRRCLGLNSVRLVNSVDFPIGRLEASDVKWLARAQPRARLALEVAIEGERQDPDNAFFPFAQALAAETLHDRRISSDALERASRCKFYDDQWYESYSLLNSASQPHLYYRVSDLHDTFTELWSEFPGLMRRFAREKRYVDLGRLLDVLYLQAMGAKNVEEFTIARRALHQLGYEGTRGLRTETRRTNDGDRYRFLTQLQQRIAAARYVPRADLPSWAACEPGGWWFEVDSGSAGELSERSFFALLNYEDALLKGTIAIESILGMFLASLILFAISKLRWFAWPPDTTPALLAFLTMIAVCFSSEWTRANEVSLVIAFLFVFVLGHFEKFKRIATIAGVSIAVTSIGLTVAFDTYGSSGNEFFGGVVYFIALARQLWLRGKTCVPGWLAAIAGIVICGLGIVTTFPVPVAEHVRTFLSVTTFALLSIAAWYGCYAGDAARRLYKALPFGLVIGCVSVIGVGMWHAWVVKEMHWLIGVEREMTESWRSALGELGPPVLNEP